MDKPRFIRGLLEEVGTAIDPVRLVRRIPEGLEIEGLREGLGRMIKEHDIQYSISSGVAKVLRGEVAAAQSSLRAGQRKGVKFDVVHKPNDHLDIATSDSPAPAPSKDLPVLYQPKVVTPRGKSKPEAGHCVGCREAFSEHEVETLVGFACGHVFHLSHLLNFGKGEEGERPLTPPELEEGRGEWDAPLHSVGGKVTHAALLRDRIRDGCPVCVVVEGS